MSDTPTNVIVTLSPPLASALELDSLEATEALGRPFRFQLEVSSAVLLSDPISLLGRSVTVGLTKPPGAITYFNGVLANLSYAGLSGGSYSYRMELRPWIWLLSRTRDCRIFQNQSPWTIITSLFSDAGYSDVEDARKNQAGSTTLEYCVQYRETTLDFVTRLMERFGLYYFHLHADGKHTLVMADDPNSHPSAAQATPFRPHQIDSRTVADHVWGWHSALQLQSGAITRRDYNFTTPSADLTTRSLQPGEHPHGNLEAYDFPGDYGVVADGQKLADIRMQDLAGQRLVHSAESNSRLLRTGSRLTLSEHSDASLNGEYMLIEATHSVTMGEARPATDSALRDTFRSQFRAIPGDTPYRLAEATAKPCVGGPQTALVVGEAGQEVTTDAYGRIKVKFYWDRAPGSDQTSSCWVRVAQPWVGTGWGVMFVPRIGQEVVVSFENGDPDHPIVIGSVYNATNTVPYTLPDNKTRSTLKSNSSLGGGGSNELRFEDKKGSEEVFLHAQKDYTKTVLNNETVTITQDSTTTIQQGNRAVTISQGNDTLTVTKGNRSVTISAGSESLMVSQGSRSVTVSTSNDSLTVSQGNHSITVTAGSSTITAGKSITLQVGGNSSTIDTTGVSVTAAKITLAAEASLQASGGSVSVAG